MKTKNKFQEKIKKQILSYLTITLILLLMGFYVGSYFINENFINNKLIEYNSKISTKIDDLFVKLSNQNQVYLDLIKVNKQELFYNNLYKTNNLFNVKTDILIYNNEKSLIFTNIQEIQKNSSFNQYLEILLTKLDKDKEQFISIKPINLENQLLFGNKDNNGYSIIKINETDLNDILGINNQYLLMDSKNHIIVSNNNKLSNNLYKFENTNNKTILLNQQNYQYEITPYNNNLKIVSFIVKTNILNMQQLSTIFLLVFILIIFSFNYFSDNISKNTSKSLDKILEEIENIKLNKSSYLNEIKTDDEFEILSYEINEMLKNIEKLNIKNTELINLNKQIEIKQLESQFNPHFLYNTLETIRYVMLEDTKLAGNLIIKLTGILRYSISNKQEEVCFNDDIVYIENYLEICKVRFQERFDYTIKYDEKCKHILIPKLILQPIIENSIKHNFISKENLSIWITADIIDDSLIVEIEDDGEGIDDYNLKMIKKALEENNNKTVHIGIYNVYRRLKLKYDNFDFRIYSKKSIGTKVTIALPIEGI